MMTAKIRVDVVRQRKMSISSIALLPFIVGEIFFSKEVVPPRLSELLRCTLIDLSAS